MYSDDLLVSRWAADDEIVATVAELFSVTPDDIMLVASVEDIEGRPRGISPCCSPSTCATGA
jgi:hypothetical protein